MTNETFKKTLNHSELYIFERLEHELNEYINDKENKIIAYENLAFNPKKNGEEKANFPRNFCMVQGEGKRSLRGEMWYYVEINRVYSIYEKEQPIKEIEIRFWSVEGAPFNESFKDYIYLGWNDLKDFLGYDLSKLENQKNLNAKFVFDLCKNYLLPKYKKELNNYKRQLNELPKDFKNLVECANKIEILYKSIKNSVVSSWAYRNFKGGNELHYLIKD